MAAPGFKTIEFECKKCGSGAVAGRGSAAVGVYRDRPPQRPGATLLRGGKTWTSIVPVSLLARP